MGKTAVFIIRMNGFKGLERDSAERVCRHLLQDSSNRDLDIFEINRDATLRLRELNNYYHVFVLIYGNLYITSEGMDSLSEITIKQKDFSVIAPVSNESTVSLQRHVPPFLYQTLSVFKWAAWEIYERYRDDVIEVKEIDNFCLAFRREVLEGLPDSSLIDLPVILKNSKLKYGVARGIYVHRYGDCYESSRDDLMVHIPLEAKDILDIGCANGLFGEMLKKRQRCIVTGVDLNTDLLEIARIRLDKVINGDIEDIVDKGILGRYDCIVCGDVLEHLKNPWKVAAGFEKHLKKGGLFIASTPNIANWAIVYEMFNGRWDYVPFSILSGTHIRFFTRDTLIELFEKNGYKIKKALLQHLEMPERAKEFINTLKKNFPEVNEEELKASGIIIVARKM